MLSALAGGPTCVMDDANYVDVLLLGEETLESASMLAVLNGANVALLGGEILQFTTAAYLSDGKYRLSGLLRGRLGTEHETVTHAVGERFILLNNRLEKEAVSENLIGLPRSYKPVTVGATLGGTAEINFAYGGRAFMPFSPVHVTAERDNSGNLTICWVRRTRIGGQWRDWVDVPLHEQSESYELDVLDGGVVVRTIHAGSPQVVYSASEQTEDFGGLQGSVEVAVYQLSAVVGRGIAAEAIV